MGFTSYDVNLLNSEKLSSLGSWTRREAAGRWSNSCQGTSKKTACSQNSAEDSAHRSCKNQEPSLESILPMSQEMQNLLGTFCFLILASDLYIVDSTPRAQSFHLLFLDVKKNFENGPYPHFICSIFYY